LNKKVHILEDAFTKKSAIHRRVVWKRVVLKADSYVKKRGIERKKLIKTRFCLQRKETIFYVMDSLLFMYHSKASFLFWEVGGAALCFC